MSRAQKILEMALQREIILKGFPTTTDTANTDGDIALYAISKDNLLKKDAASESTFNHCNNLQNNDTFSFENAVDHQDMGETVTSIFDTACLEYNAHQLDETVEGKDLNNENGFTNNKGETKSEEEPLIKRKKRRHVQQSNWKREENKKSRERGKRYYGKKVVNTTWKYDLSRKERRMKSRCLCKKLKCYQLTEHVREKLFNEFWQLDWNEKHLYIELHVKSSSIIRQRDRKIENSSRRTNSFTYYLRTNDEMIKVCKKMFLNTLDIGEWTVRSWKLKKEKSDNEVEHVTGQEDNRAIQIEHKSKRTLRDERSASLKEFLNLLPKMESHYCRSTTTKLYLEPIWKSKQQLYEVYSKEWCQEKQINPLSNTYFFNMFDDLNLSLFSRKKDECDICVARKTNNIPQEEYDVHVEKKKEARIEKDADKKSDKNKVFTMDLQAVLLSPKSNVSSSYYKTKLAVHNFTIYDIKTHDAYCFIWNESEGTVGANEFSTIICHFLEYQLETLKPNEDFKNLQKYLEKGHTQMEADSMHSCIERQLRKQNINVPAEYVKICTSARKIPKPYVVKYLHHTFFKNYSKVQVITSIRPGRNITGDPVVTDIRALRYNPNGTIDFKLRHSEEWKELSIRTKRNTSIATMNNNISPLYESKLKIKTVKYNHLQQLKKSLDSDYHGFYDSLSHE